jgi:hypothetical protein
MSRRKEADEYGSAENGGWPDETRREEEAVVAEAAAQEEGTAATKAEAEARAAVPPVFLAIEDHAKARHIAAPVFAAVRQMKGWSEGKKVGEAEFDEAVSAFLNAPARASAPIGGKK